MFLCQISLLICISYSYHMIKLLLTNCSVNAEKYSDFSSSYGPHSVRFVRRSCGPIAFTAQSVLKCLVSAFHRPISQCQMMVYDGGRQSFKCIFFKQYNGFGSNLQGLYYEVCCIVLPNFSHSEYLSDPGP